MDQLKAINKEHQELKGISDVNNNNSEEIGNADGGSKGINI
jgi:hypothetical protein